MYVIEPEARFDCLVVFQVFFRSVRPSQFRSACEQDPGTDVATGVIVTTIVHCHFLSTVCSHGANKYVGSLVN